MSKKQEYPSIQYDRFLPVAKSNDLILHSRYSLSAQQQKIVLYLISKIKPEDSEFDLYNFDIGEFCKICGITDAGKNYKLIREQIKKITDQSIWVTLPDGTTTVLRWIEKPFINEKTNEIKIRLDKEMKPYLLQLKDNFTSYSYAHTLSFKSGYSIRLYEYLKAKHYYSGEPYTFSVSIDDLKARLDAEGYVFAQFHQKVLAPAVKELNKMGDEKVSYCLKKEGRNVVAVEFTCKLKPEQEQLETWMRIEERLGE